jgi:hypothetical protein
MKDLSSPISIGGRHWGAFRMALGHPDFATGTPGSYAQRYNSVNMLQRKAIELAKFTLLPFTQINYLPGDLLQHTLI